MRILSTINDVSKDQSNSIVLAVRDITSLEEELKSLGKTKEELEKEAELKTKPSFDIKFLEKAQKELNKDKSKTLLIEIYII